MNEARAEPSLLGLCLARRRKTIVKAPWRRSDTVPEAVVSAGIVMLKC